MVLEEFSRRWIPGHRGMSWRLALKGEPSAMGVLEAPNDGMVGRDPAYSDPCLLVPDWFANPSYTSQYPVVCCLSTGLEIGRCFCRHCVVGWPGLCAGSRPGTLDAESHLILTTGL
jgi:hypothetical protein